MENTQDLKAKTTKELHNIASKYRDNDPRIKATRAELDRRAFTSIFEGIGMTGPFFKSEGGN